MKVTIVEGTPDEISKAFPQLNGIATVVQPTSPTTVTFAQEANELAADGIEYVSTEMFRHALKRRPLSKNQLIVLKSIYHAHPGTILASELQKQTGTSTSEFAGLMGALGRRVTHTQGYIDNASYLKVIWDSEAGCKRYWMPDTVRKAMEIVKLV